MATIPNHTGAEALTSPGHQPSSSAPPAVSGKLGDWLPFIVAISLTGCVLSGGYMIYFYLSKQQEPPNGFDSIEKLGSYLSGIFGLISVVWICATFLAQMRQLSLQRQELQLQRRASQSAAISFRSQIVISLHDRAIEAMSETVRSLVLLIVKDEQDLLQNLHETYNSGDRYAYIHFAIDLKIFNKCLVRDVQEGITPVLYLINLYCQEADQLATLINREQVPEDIAQYLYKANPVHMLRENLALLRNSNQVS